ncbi:hypothetical protein ACQ4M3_31950 [Leptolyngbya sp. AN03gr2]|uniref:hypothetical protein n=1 Tax=unclassified Leptolyngbya TaxID=2650499 RepID=UPI003D3236BA
MSWHTSCGDRVLEGSEAAFYLTAVQHAIEHLQELQDIEEEIDVVTGASFASPKVTASSTLPALIRKSSYCTLVSRLC